MVRELPRLQSVTGRLPFSNGAAFCPVLPGVRARTRTHAGLASMRGISTGSRCRSGSGRRRLCRGGTGFEGLWELLRDSAIERVLGVLRGGNDGSPRPETFA